MFFSNLDKQALKRLRENWGSCYLITLALCAVFFLAGIMSYIIDHIAMHLGFYELSRFKAIFATPLAAVYIVSKIYIIYILVMPSISHLLRYLWCASQGKEQEDMAKFKKYKKRFGFIAFKFSVAAGGYMLIPLLPCTMLAFVAGHIGQSFINDFSVLKIFLFTIAFLSFMILLVVSGVFFLNIIMILALCIINPEISVRESFAAAKQMAKLRRTEIIVFNIKFILVYALTCFFAPLPIFLMTYLVFMVINMQDTVGEYYAKQGKITADKDFYTHCDDNFFDAVDAHLKETKLK